MQSSTAAQMNEFAKALGVRIRQGRKAAQLTQEAFADRCQIYRSYLTNIEAGKANPSLSVLLSIAVQLKVPLWKLMQVDPRTGWREVEGLLSNETGQTLEYVRLDRIEKSTKKLSTNKKANASKM